jgi:tRNA nucleotidyltransferase (CCA-adding enzyme)
MNSILWDFISGELIDPFQGREDLQKSILRHTGPQFPEDPLRVLRAMQFAARFKLEVAPETIELCKNVYPETLSKERVFEEWKKLLTRGVTPSLGLKFLRNCGWVQYYPELLAMIGCKQDTTWHPEGDVWTHTLHCMDAFARERLNDSEEDLIVGFAVLCHDIGKPTTTVLEDGRIRSPGHESLGKALTRNYLKRMTNQEDLIESIVPLVANHLRPMEFFKSNAGDSAIRRLANKVKRIDRLVRVASADEQGRPPKSHDLTAVNWLLSRASALKVKDSAPAPLVLGRHLIKIGLKPGNYFGEILSQCYEAQLEGSFFDLEGGRKYAANLIKNRNNSNEI